MQFNVLFLDEINLVGTDSAESQRIYPSCFSLTVRYLVELAKPRGAFRIESFGEI